MRFHLHPLITIETGLFHAIISPGEIILESINNSNEFQRFLFLYISGNYSSLLTGINRNVGHFYVQRAFTAFQLLSILREAHHTIIFLEHDASLFDGDGSSSLHEVARALKHAAKEAAVILYSRADNKTFRYLSNSADRVFYFIPQLKYQDHKHESGHSKVEKQYFDKSQAKLII